MQIVSSLDEIAVDGVWLTIGSFDGVHRGHQEIIRHLVTGAHKVGAPAVVLTFYPHPTVVLRGITGPYYLTSPEERSTLLSELGVDIVIIQHFDRQLADTSAREYVLKLKKQLGLKRLLVGHDFTLGKGREGNIPTLEHLGKELSFEVEVTQPVLFDSQVISSSQIRAALAEGNVAYVHNLLGRPFSITGVVVPGDGRGRTIGIPTANLNVWHEQLLPKTGVYVCRARIEAEVFGAATNIGIRPTFDGSAPLIHVEAHILDFNRDIYNQKVSLDFLARLRGEQKFPNVQELVKQIHADIEQARQLLAQASPT